MENTGGVRKGAWTYKEDEQLKACINTYGEGKWNLVPQRSGLNRCRKSCRLRWLNYLSPNINRGRFSEDEVDLILRLHKILGNRWSLIAGRLPGRTANDVKNYWHTNLAKKVVSEKEEEKEKHKPKETMKAHEVIKPRPITLSSHSNWLKGKNSIPRDLDYSETMASNQIGRDCASASKPNLGNDSMSCAKWCDSLCNLGEQVDCEKIGSCSSLQEENLMEFPNVDDSFWDFNPCDFNSLWDLP